MIRTYKFVVEVTMDDGDFDNANDISEMLETKLRKFEQHSLCTITEFRSISKCTVPEVIKSRIARKMRNKYEEAVSEYASENELTIAEVVAYLEKLEHVD
jgi:hypothetical protein